LELAMSAVIAIGILLIIVVGLAAFCVLNALRIKRHLNQSLNTFRTRLEDEANAVVDALLNQADNRPPRSPDASHPSTSD
jgi:sensor domain CHASE-containing protein